jgi:membrane-associated phospholipid phosphatase
VVAGFVAITVARSWHLGIPLRDPSGSIVVQRVEITAELLVLMVLADAVWAGVRRRSLAAVGRHLRDAWPARRTWAVLSALVAYFVVYGCYRNLKSWDAFNTPHDHQLETIDRALFGGHSPAVLLHDLLGQHYAAIALADVYGSFTKLVTVSVVGTLVFVRPVRRAYLFTVSAIWVWILGTASYYLIPTLGPFATSPRDFAGLTETSITRSQSQYLVDRAHLLTDPTAHDAFASISAFASLHVAFTCFVLLMAHRYGHRRLTIALGIYLGLIVVSTVYGGMHFVVDDVAGVLLALLGVRLGQLTVGADVRPERTPRPERQPDRA